MKIPMLARILLATALLALCMNVAMAEQDNLTDNFNLVSDIYNNSNASNMPSPSNTSELFEIPEFSNLTPNMTANYRYFKVNYLYP